MNRRIILLLFAAGIFSAAPLTKGQIYAGSVLYPLTPPSGFIVAHSSGNQQSAFTGENVGYGSGNGTSGNDHALLWTTNGAAVDLNPANFTSSYVVGTDGAQQVGSGFGSATGGSSHALLWTGTAVSAVDLNPSGFDVSAAYVANDNQQVGQGFGSGTGNNYHALLWTGTAASAIDLNPTNLNGFYMSEAEGTDGTHQVGAGINSQAGDWHALLWTDTADSAVDLNPNDFEISFAIGTSGTQQVGYGVGSEATGNDYHALLWAGTADSAVDLNPSGFVASFANGTNGSEQVGSGYEVLGYNRALLWTGTADSAVDLQALLPANDIWQSSEAYTVDSSDNVYGTAVDSNGETFAVEWSPVPEPTMGSILLITTAQLLVFRRRR